MSLMAVAVKKTSVRRCWWYALTGDGGEECPVF